MKNLRYKFNNTFHLLLSKFSFLFSLLLFSRSVVFKSLQPHGLQYARLPYPSPSPRACSNSCPLSWWCHSTTLSSVIPFSSCLQSFPTSGWSWLFTSITIISNYIVYLIYLLSVYSNLNVNFLKATPCVFSFLDVSSASRTHLISIGKLKTN